MVILGAAALVGKALLFCHTATLQTRASLDTHYGGILTSGW